MRRLGVLRDYIAACALVLGTEGCFILPRQAPPAPVRKSEAARKADALDSANRAMGLKPYAKLIPGTAHSSAGLFQTHRVGDTLYFEIPRRELNKDMLLVG